MVLEAETILACDGLYRRIHNSGAADWRRTECPDAGGCRRRARGTIRRLPQRQRSMVLGASDQAEHVLQGGMQAEGGYPSDAQLRRKLSAVRKLMT